MSSNSHGAPPSVMLNLDVYEPFDERICLDKLHRAGHATDVIRQTAAWIFHHRGKMPEFVRIWIAEFRRASPSRRLNLYYVAHETLVLCQKLKFDKGFICFQSVLREATVYSRDSQCKAGVRELLDVFAKAAFFPEEFLQNLREDLERGKSRLNYNKTILMDFDPADVIASIHEHMEESPEPGLAKLEAQYAEMETDCALEILPAVMSKIKEHSTGKGYLEQFDSAFITMTELMEAREEDLEHEYHLLNQLELLRVHYGTTANVPDKLILHYLHYEYAAQIGLQHLETAQTGIPRLPCGRGMTTTPPAGGHAKSTVKTATQAEIDSVIDMEMSDEEDTEKNEPRFVSPRNPGSFVQNRFHFNQTPQFGQNNGRFPVALQCDQIRHWQPPPSARFTGPMNFGQNGGQFPSSGYGFEANNRFTSPGPSFEPPPPLTGFPCFPHAQYNAAVAQQVLRTLSALQDVLIMTSLLSPPQSSSPVSSLSTICQPTKSRRPTKLVAAEQSLIRLAERDSRTLSLSSLPRKTSAVELKALMPESTWMGKQGSRAFLVSFASEAIAEKYFDVLTKGDSKVKGQAFVVDYCGVKSKYNLIQSSPRVGKVNQNVLLIDRLESSEAIRDFFPTAIEVSTRYCQQEASHSAWVRFADQDTARAAFHASENAVIAGQRVTVVYALKSKKKAARHVAVEPAARQPAGQEDESEISVSLSKPVKGHGPSPKTPPADLA